MHILAHAERWCEMCASVGNFYCVHSSSTFCEWIKMLYIRTELMYVHWCTHTHNDVDDYSFFVVVGPAVNKWYQTKLKHIQNKRREWNGCDLLHLATHMNLLSNNTSNNKIIIIIIISASLPLSFFSLFLSAGAQRKCVHTICVFVQLFWRAGHSTYSVWNEDCTDARVLTKRQMH